MTAPKVQRRLLAEMVRLRTVEEAIAAHYAEQQMRCPVHLSVGQEAPSAAFALAVQPADYAVSTHRSHAHFLAKGGSLEAMIAELHGKGTGCSKGRGGSMHLADAGVGFMGSSAIVGNSIPVGVGLALALQLQGRRQASCIFLGDGATEEGVFFESVNFAVVRALPAVFLCENNLYSVYSPLSVRQPPERSITEMVRALGAPAVQVDGNDAGACLAAIDAALADARRGGGPRFVEFLTFRHLEHCGPQEDDDLGYRRPGELESWRERDPIEHLRRGLLGEDSGVDDFLSATAAAVSAEVQAAFEAARRAPYPDLDEAMADVYA